MREHKMNRVMVKCAAVALVLAAALLSASFPTVALGQTPVAPKETLPSTETVRSLFMNNWTDTVAVNYSRQLYKKDSHLVGPYLSELHSAVDWPTNQIDGAMASFRADVLDANGKPVSGSGGQPLTGPEQPPTLCPSSGPAKGDDAPVDSKARDSYPSVMCFDDGGILNVEYTRETELGLPIQVQKSYAMPPNQHFLVVRYTLTNNLAPQDQRSVRVRLAEMVDLHNKGERTIEKASDQLSGTGINEGQPSQPTHNQQVQWHPELNAWIADMSASNGTILVFGAFQDIDRHRAFQTASDQPVFPGGIEPEIQALDHADLPQNVDQANGLYLGLSLWKEAVLGPTSKQQYAFFYAVTSSLAQAQEVARQARQPTTPDFWFTQTRTAYQAWLQKGQQVNTPDAGLSKAYVEALITDKQSQQPQFGSFVAATNPAYGFKVWARDSSVTALGLAASGHFDEAVKYYRWMASVQEDGSRDKFPPGTWDTTYSYWFEKKQVPFAAPENDSLGLFMIGVYHTWRLLNQQDPQAAREFLTGSFPRVGQGPTSVYEAVTRSADYIASHIDQYGFGPSDYSIWEEYPERATFTQVAYASGLNAARLLANAMGEPDRASKWLDGARRVREAILRPASAKPCPGLWNDAESRWNRGTMPDCTTDNRLDASTDVVWVFGLVDAGNQRDVSQRKVVLSRLAHGLGVARYEGDTFYNSSPYSPGGQFEASAAMPSWPQMDMYVDMLEHWTGLNDIALQRLQWYAKVTNVGYAPPGEAVDWTNDHPLPSTSSEPVTDAWYVLGLLNYLDRFDPRLPSLDAVAASGPTPTPSPSPSPSRAP